MEVMLWGGRSKARIIIEMIAEIYRGGAGIVGIFDITLEEIPFNTSAKLYSKKHELEFLCKEVSHFVVCIRGENW